MSIIIKNLKTLHQMSVREIIVELVKTRSRGARVRLITSNLASCDEKTVSQIELRAEAYLSSPV